MKVMPTRRTRRTVYRRSRVYIPAAVLLLLGMIVLLPLSARWMASSAERRILAATGLQFDIDHLRIVLALGDVSLSGIELHGAGEPFRIEKAELTGNLASLAAGDGTWPERVELSSPSPLRVVQKPDGPWMITGATRTLAREITRVAQENGGNNSANKSTEKSRALKIPATPHLVLRNAQVDLKPPNPEFPDVRIFVDFLEVDRRRTGLEPVVARAQGTVTARGTESWRVQGNWNPDTGFISFSGVLGGLSLPMDVPRLGRIRLNLQGVSLSGTVGGVLTDAQSLEVSLTLSANRFELSETRLGGERWIDRDLRIRLAATLDPNTGAVEVRTLELLGENISISSQGTLTINERLPADIALRIRRLPDPVLRLASERILEETSFSVEPSVTSPTLRLDLMMKGEFAGEVPPRAEVSLTAAGWRVSGPAWPEAIELQQLRTTASPERLTVHTVDIASGGIRAAVAFDLPGPMAPEGAVPGTWNIHSSGDAQRLLVLLQRYGAVPKQIASVRLPFSLDASGRLEGALRLDADPLRALRPSVDHGVFTWESGELVLYDFAERITVEPGEVAVDDGVWSLRRMVANVGTTLLRANGEIIGPSLGPEPPNFRKSAAELHIIAQGNIEEVNDVLARALFLPFAPDIVTGEFHAELDVKGTADRLSEPDYRLRLNASNLSAQIPVEQSMLQLRDASFDLVLTTSTLVLHRLDAVVEDMDGKISTLSISATADDQHLAVEGMARTHFETMRGILRKDLNDFHAAGELPVELSAALQSRHPLEPGSDVLRRWIATLDRRWRRIGITQDSPLRLTYRADLRQSSPLEFYSRDFPIPIENIRGAAWATEEGIFFQNVLADIGETKDAEFSGRVLIGRPTKVFFETEMAWLPVTQWLGNWGDQPWSTRPYSFPRVGTGESGNRLVVIVEGGIKADRAEFLRHIGREVTGKIRYEYYTKAPAKLFLNDLRTKSYGGSGEVEAEFTFDRSKLRPHLRLDGRMTDFDVTDFLTVMRNKPEEMVGSLSGTVHFEGSLLDQPTYTAHGEFVVRESALIGGQVFKALRQAFRLTGDDEPRNTTITGTVAVANREVVMPDLIITNPVVSLFANGKITFDSKLDFGVTANVVSRRFRSVPVLREVFRGVDMLGDALLSFHVKGTINEPSVDPVPLMMDRVGLLRRTSPSGMDEAERGDLKKRREEERP